MARTYKLQIYRHTVSNKIGPDWLNIDNLDIHPFFLEALADLGIIEIKDGKLQQKDLSRIQKIQRLRNSLGVNLSGACIIIELLDKLEKLEDELNHFRRR